MPVYPSRAKFLRLAREGLLFPFVAEVGDVRPADLYEGLRALPAGRQAAAPAPSLLLESSRFHPQMGRWSFVLAGPFARFTSKGNRWRFARAGVSESGSGDPFGALKTALRRFRLFREETLPPFVGGAAGILNFELKNAIETPKTRVADPWGLPDIDLGFFDEGFAFDHLAGRAFAFAAVRAGRALGRSYCAGIARLEGVAARAESAGQRRSTPPAASVDTEKNAERFMRGVEKIKRHIRAGDVFQVNLSHCLTFGFSGDLFGLYRRQTAVNPVSFGAFADFGPLQILCGSPERLVRAAGGRISTRPIAGTRPRSADPAEDRRFSAELLMSPKERAEHVMLVDLERNDLGRVSRYGSVRVDEMMTVENYSHVRHIVSEISGLKRRDRHAVDVIRAVFPGGTITGAPKVRAIELIDEIEGAARGPYTGSLGYIGFDGDMDFNIVIRSLAAKDGVVRLSVGAGIVADSDPEREYLETLDKAKALLEALEIRPAFYREPVPAG